MGITVCLFASRTQSILVIVRERPKTSATNDSVGSFRAERLLEAAYVAAALMTSTRKEADVGCTKRNW